MNTPRAASWGRYPPYPQTLRPCRWRSELPGELRQLAQAHKAVLPFGNGRSYGDSCLSASDTLLALRPLNRFISADWETGLIRAEAGVTLEEILSLAIPRGWFLPVTPGTKYVTLGGAIANDVHGKNHHARGTFGCHVRSFALTRSDRPTLVCTGAQNAELFAATIGGLGLTGVIEWAEVQLIPIRSSMVDTITIRFGSTAEFFHLCDELDQSHEYTVAWVDCLSRGSSAGRGVFMAGNHAPEGVLQTDNRRKLTVPFVPPFSAINTVSLRALNSIYYRAHRTNREPRRVSYDPFFYPLDRILNWNRIYGPRGFQQYQCVIPNENAEPAITEVLDTIARAATGSFLAVMKKCGRIASPGLLSFPLPGVSLALDFPQHRTLNNTLFSRLDSIVRDSGGRLYPAKDAHMSSGDFRHFFPNWAQLESLRDPALCSRFWQRVTDS